MQMPRLETICRSILDDDGFGKKVLIGGVLFYLPVLNLLLLGYFYRYARSIREDSELRLPEWNRWQDMVVESLRMLVIVLVFVVAPVLVAVLLAWLAQVFFGALQLDVFAATLGLIPLSLAALLVPPLALAALSRHQVYGDFNCLLKWERIVRAALRIGPAQLVVLLVFWGLMLVGWPLLGFSFFLGFGLLVAYYTAQFMANARTQSGASK